MSPRLPRTRATEAIRVLEKLGFSLARQSGSHKIYKNAAGKRVTVPFHAGKILHPRVLKSIIEDAGLTVEEYLELL
ncbi:MAG: type II toxin-antitoxin system HicA family toxin [Anaerolineae bacterium]